MALGRIEREGRAERRQELGQRPAQQGASRFALAHRLDTLGA